MVLCRLPQFLLKLKHPVTTCVFHQGHIGCGIWCCQFTSLGVLLTGGADSSIKLWDSNIVRHASDDHDPQAHGNAKRMSATMIMSLQDSTVRSLSIGSQLNRIYIGTSNGALMVADIHDPNGPTVAWKLLFQFKDPGPCTCVNVTESSGRDLVFAGHCKGIGVATVLEYGHVPDHQATGI